MIMISSCKDDDDLRRKGDDNDPTVVSVMKRLQLSCSIYLYFRVLGQPRWLIATARMILDRSPQDEMSSVR